MTNFQHLAIAVLLQCFIGLVTGNWWAGAALSAGIFAGREHAYAVTFMSVSTLFPGTGVLSTFVNLA